MGTEYELVNKLTNKKYTISTAESCTGGLLSGAIVGVDGASEVFGCGFVTYSEKAKEQLVQVKHDTLIRCGAVSAETAGEMAVGCERTAKSDMGLSTTGIAGPGGGTAETPVGLVYIGCSLHNIVKTRRFFFQGDRNEVRSQAVEAALKLALECLEEEVTAR